MKANHPKTETKENVRIRLEGVTLEGQLVVPAGALGLIIFSHGSGSSRFSPRNNFVAQHLQRRQFATFLFDLLTAEEDDVFRTRFNIPLLSSRLEQVTRQLIRHREVGSLPVGYFGASTGSASALTAASALQSKVRAVVSRGGRPDLAEHLDLVKAPTLLIVGERDTEVIALNREAMKSISALTALRIVAGASHLFEEPGALEEVAKLSAEWFAEHLVVQRSLQLQDPGRSE